MYVKDIQKRRLLMYDTGLLSDHTKYGSIAKPEKNIAQPCRLIPLLGFLAHSACALARSIEP